MPLDHDNATDALCMVRYQRGDFDAFAELVDRHADRVFSYARRRVGALNLAEALTEQVFLRLAKNAGHFKHEDRFAAWLYSIVYETCRVPESAESSIAGGAPADREARKGAVQRDASDNDERRKDETRSATGSPDESLDVQTAAARAIEALPESTRDIFLLRHIANLPLSDIAAIVGSDEPSVRAEIRHALERLQEALGGFEEYAKALR
jgi:RNA polymerase sigma-70 factor (ECF subfamily)